MRTAVSNLAWDNRVDRNFFQYMKMEKIYWVELVFTKIAHWNHLTANEVKDYMKFLRNEGMNCESAQSIFYQTEYNVVGTSTLKHFEKLIVLAAAGGIKTLVFGSPSMRKKFPGWEKQLQETFIKVDKMLEKISSPINIVIEPNASIYGGEYFHSTSEIKDFIVGLNLKFIKTMVDTHNSLLEGNDPSADLINNFKYISHIHVSEPELNPINKNIDFHKKFSETLKKTTYRGLITYEVLDKKDQSNYGSCNRDILGSLPLFARIYE